MKFYSVSMTLPCNSHLERGIFLFRRLQAISRKCEVRALCPNPWFPGLRSASPQRSDFDGLKIAHRKMFYIPGFAKVLDGWWMKRCVVSWLKECSPLPSDALLDAHFGYPEGVGCLSAAIAWGIPCFISLRGVEVDWFRVPRVRSQMVQALNDATGVIAVSQSLKDLAVENGVVSDQIKVISNGCDSSLFHPGDKQQARQLLGLDSQKTLLVSVANLKPVKGHDVLIRALSAVRADCQLLIVGKQDDPHYAAEIRYLAGQLGVAARVVLVGVEPPNRVAEYLRAADLFVLGSRREGCCNALIEAMATGCPVVATDVGDNRKLLESYGAKRIVVSGNAQAFAESIESMIANPIGNSPSASAQFANWDQVADQTIDYFETRLRAWRSKQP